MEQRANIKLGKTAETREMFIRCTGGKPWAENVLTTVKTLLRRDGNDWGWATFGSAIDKQNPRNDRESATNAGTRSATDAEIDCGGNGFNKDWRTPPPAMIWVSGKSAPDVCRTSSQTSRKQKGMETSRDFISMCDQDPLLVETSSREMRSGATSSIRNQNGNWWQGVHRLPQSEKKESSAKVKGQNTVDRLLRQQRIQP